MRSTILALTAAVALSACGGKTEAPAPADPVVVTDPGVGAGDRPNIGDGAPAPALPLTSAPDAAAKVDEK